MATRPPTFPGPIEELSGAALEAAARIYASLSFAPSHPIRDRTFGTLAGDALCSLGRLQRYTDGALEIGGFWVAEDHRRCGLARGMVDHVLAQVPLEQTAWCLPFAHLLPFYRSFGLRDANHLDAPLSIQGKFATCIREHVEGRLQPVHLLQLERHG